MFTYLLNHNSTLEHGQRNKSISEFFNYVEKTKGESERQEGGWVGVCMGGGGKNMNFKTYCIKF